MSKLFESLRKAELVTAEDFGLTEFESLAAPTPTRGGRSEKPQTPDKPPASVQIEEYRSAGVKVSGSSPILPFSEADHAAAEQYRIIRTKILHHPRRPKLIVVSSGGSGDGKTVTSINVAASLALKDGMRVAIIDADMRRPQVAKMLGIEQSPGLGEVLTGVASFEEAASRIEQFPNLWVLPAGAQRQFQTELLDSERWLALASKLRAEFDCVIFDAPPIATVADYELVQCVCDGVVVVARPDHSERGRCLRTLELVPRDKLLGVVLNCVENWFLFATHSYGYYTQESAKK